MPFAVHTTLSEEPMSRPRLLSLTLFACLNATALAPASAGAAVEGRASQQTVNKISYGSGIEIARLSGDQHQLKGPPGSFKRFSKARLGVLFEEAGSKLRHRTPDRR